MPEENKIIHLEAHEVQLIAIVAKTRNFTIDPAKTEYTRDELAEIGFVRENWSVSELSEMGFSADAPISCFDDVAKRAESELVVDVPFASGVKKWQLPIALPNFRVITTRFPPNTVVKLHEHPNFDGVSDCGQLRVVTKGSITYDGRKYGPGDWFFIPNGVPYSFVTDPHVESEENYFYQYNSHGLPLRFSSPQAVEG